MSCPSESDSNRENLTWAWSASRCPSVNPDITDCPDGFKGSIGPKEDSNIKNPGTCGNWYSYGNRVKCYKDLSYWSQDDKVKCCTGEKSAYACPTSFCAKNTSNCVNILSDYCRIGNNITTEACSKVLKEQDVSVYNEILKKYCKGENLNSQVCKGYCSENVNYCRDELKIFCKDKVGKPNYAKICACFYEDKVYNNMSKKLADEWNFPSELNDPRPQCIYDACKQADIVPEGTCKAINIASCLQNVIVDTAGNTNIGNVYVNQDSDCKSSFDKVDKRDGNSSTGGSSTGGKSTGGSSTGGKSTGGKSTGGADGNKSTGMSKVIIGMILFALVAFLLIAIIVMIKK
jgi:uncharacterized membrane protein YgcG